MSTSVDPLTQSVTWVADTGVFITCDRQQNNKYAALERPTTRNDSTFVIP